ncbi:hypothetical protein [Nocardia sp. NPDC019395]
MSVEDYDKPGAVGCVQDGPVVPRRQEIAATVPHRDPDSAAAVPFRLP